MAHGAINTDWCLDAVIYGLLSILKMLNFDTMQSDGSV